MSKAAAKQARKIAEPYQEKVQKLQDKGQNVPSDNIGFKGKYFDRSAKERKLDLLKQMSKELAKELSEDGGKGVQVAYTPTQADVDVFLEKDKQEKLYDFEDFVGKLFNFEDPNHIRLLKQIYPSFYERRLTQIGEDLDLQKRLAKLKLLGVQDVDDLILMYGLYTGEIEEPTDPVNLPQKWGPTQGKADYRRGLLNFYRPVQKGNPGVGSLGALTQGVSKVNEGKGWYQSETKTQRRRTGRPGVGYKSNMQSFQQLRNLLGPGL